MEFLCIIAILFVSVTASDVIVTNHVTCTDIGTNLLQRGATAQEIFIAVAVCEGVVHPQDSGLGGGFQATIHNSACQKVAYLNSRECAPSYWPDAYSNTRQVTKIGVPSVLKGYENIYKMNLCGDYKPTLEWRDLFSASMTLATHGVKTPLRMLYIMRYVGGQTFTLNGRIMTNPALGETLRRIVHEGPSSSLYQFDGYLNKIVTSDLRSSGSWITKYDLLDYKAKRGNAIKCTANGLTYFTSNLPGSGRALCFAIKVASHVFANHKRPMTIYARFNVYIQVQRYMYAIQPHLKAIKYHQLLQEVRAVANTILRLVTLHHVMPLETPTRFGNLTLPSLTYNQPYGTTNVVVKVGNTTIVATSTINSSFGSKLYSNRLGFFYNNQLMDFSYNPSHPNAAKENAYPQSSISTTIAVDKNGTSVFMVGAAGGRKIMGAIFGVWFNYFHNNMTLQQAVDAPRCIVIDSLTCEPSLEPTMRSYILMKYLNVYWKEEAGYSAVTAATNDEAVYDVRRGGKGYIRNKVDTTYLFIFYSLPGGVKHSKPI